MSVTPGSDRHLWTVTLPRLWAESCGVRALCWLCTGPASSPNTPSERLSPALCPSLASSLLWGPLLSPSPGSGARGSEGGPEAGLTKKQAPRHPTRGASAPSHGVPAIARGPLHVAGRAKKTIPSPSRLPAPSCKTLNTLLLLAQPQLFHLYNGTLLCLRLQMWKCPLGHES